MFIRRLRDCFDWHTGFEMTRMLASGEESATALARSRTMDALVLKRSVYSLQYLPDDGIDHGPHTITSHAGFPRNTGWDQDDLRPCQRLLQPVVIWLVACDDALGVDVTNIGSDTCHGVSFGLWGGWRYC